ncbi:MAG: hypothetical protein HYY49_04935 [Ignavibacteriales bacterium]|nr:hypothetical protein [Ignavibacteriales bacterium]
MRLRNLACCLLLSTALLQGQQTPQNADKFSTWLYFQFVPNLTWTSFPAQTNFAFEWEATPVLYSFGMTKLLSPWYSLIVEPPARFTGSIEFNVSGLLYTSKAGSSHFGSSLQLLAHVPLIERGEHLALNAGVARYYVANSSPTFYVGGLSSLFGLLHLNVKYSANPKIWMTSLEIRIF